MKLALILERIDILESKVNKLQETNCILLNKINANQKSLFNIMYEGGLI